MWFLTNLTQQDEQAEQWKDLFKFDWNYQFIRNIKNDSRDKTKAKSSIRNLLEEALIEKASTGQVRGTNQNQPVFAGIVEQSSNRINLSSKLPRRLFSSSHQNDMGITWSTC